MGSVQKSGHKGKSQSGVVNFIKFIGGSREAKPKKEETILPDGLPLLTRMQNHFETDNNLRLKIDRYS
jgi:hypothetical protein